MDIWSQIFAEKSNILIKFCVRTDREGGAGAGGGKSAKCGQVRTAGRGVKNHGPY